MILPKLSLTITSPSYLLQQWRQAFSLHQKAYLVAFVLALLLCWSPDKFLGYIAPWLALVTFIGLSFSERSFRNLALFLLVGSLVFLSYAYVIPDFASVSATLALLTYSSFIFMLIIPTRAIASPSLWKAVLAISSGMLLFQGVWGLVQGVASAVRTGTFDGATGDAVAGTIRPFAVSPDLSNPIFAINVVFLLLVLLPRFMYGKGSKIAFIIGLLALILASVLHVLIFATIALAVAFILINPMFFLRKRGVLIVVLFAVTALIASSLLGRNFATLQNYVRYTAEGRTPRSQIIVRSVTVIPEAYPWMPIIGLGPGQFSSRAGFIGTGMYFGTPRTPRPLPFIEPDMSEPFETYLLDLWLSLFFDKDGNDIHKLDNTSSTVKPYFSWLSLYTEFGLIGVSILLLFVATMLWRVMKRTYHDKVARITAVSFTAGILFLLLIGFQENYWEVPQAIFIGLMLLKMQYGLLNTRNLDFTTC